MPGSGRRAPISVTESEEVLVANTVSSGSTSASSVKRAAFVFPVLAYGLDEKSGRLLAYRAGRVEGHQPPQHRLGFGAARPPLTARRRPGRRPRGNIVSMRHVPDQPAGALSAALQQPGSDDAYADVVAVTGSTSVGQTGVAPSAPARRRRTMAGQHRRLPPRASTDHGAAGRRAMAGRSSRQPVRGTGRRVHVAGPARCRAVRAAAAPPCRARSSTGTSARHQG